MRTIGLTGSIACGKSNVSQALRQLGAAVIDGDLLSRELTAPGGMALPALRETFGEGVFLPDGQLDRRALGSRVFGDPSALDKLNGILHPMIIALTKQRIEESRLAGAPLCVLDMPLLYETGMDALCDRVWCVWIPRETQLQRLMDRDGFTREEAENRLASQLCADEKASRAHVVIDTSGSIEYTKSMIPALYQRELALAP